MKLSVIFISMFLVCLVSHYQYSCTAGIIALKLQSLIALKQALIASRLPFGQPFILYPGVPVVPAIPLTTRRPNVTTMRPAVIATTQRPITVIVQQLYPGMHYLPIEGTHFPQGIQFPIGQIPGQQIPSLGVLFPGAVQRPLVPFPVQNGAVAVAGGTLTNLIPNVSRPG